jgi:regulator of cell morphogenesis and NO signaling
MTIITPDNKLADVVLRNYHLIPVINRFGIELGFGDKKISEICRDYQIDADFFAALLNTISYESYFSDKSLNASNTLQLIK